MQNLEQMVEETKQILSDTGRLPVFTVNEDDTLTVSASQARMNEGTLKDIVRRDGLNEWARNWVAYDDTAGDYYDDHGVDAAEELGV